MICPMCPDTYTANPFGSEIFWQASSGVGVCPILGDLWRPPPPSLRVDGACALPPQSLFIFSGQMNSSKGPEMAHGL